MKRSNRWLKVHEIKLRNLMKKQEAYESDSEEFLAINQRIGRIVADSDYELAWVVDVFETVIH